MSTGLHQQTLVCAPDLCLLPVALGKNLELPCIAWGLSLQVLVCCLCAGSQGWKQEALRLVIS